MFSFLTISNSILDSGYLYSENIKKGCKCIEKCAFQEKITKHTLSFMAGADYAKITASKCSALYGCSNSASKSFYYHRVSAAVCSSFFILIPHFLHRKFVKSQFSFKYY